jgi:hypothetical protein
MITALMRARCFRGAVERLRTRDPERDALRRAGRAAIVVPLAAAVSFFVVGGSQAPLFTALRQHLCHAASRAPARSGMVIILPGELSTDVRTPAPLRGVPAHPDQASHLQ